MKHRLKSIREAALHAENTPARVAQQIKQLIDGVSSLHSLSTNERKHTLKPHTGAERYATHMAALAITDPRCAPTGLDAAQIARDLETAESLDELHSVVSAALQKIEDTQLLLRSNAYRAALDVYSVAQSLARRDPDLHTKIAAFEQFLATGSRSTKPAKS